MRLALPIHEGRLSAHFGHAEQFIFVDIDPDSHQVNRLESVTPPEHQPGALPRWLQEQGAEVVIAGGMGMHAQQLLEQNGIKVMVGAPALDPESLVKSYLNQTLVVGSNSCDH